MRLTPPPLSALALTASLGLAALADARSPAPSVPPTPSSVSVALKFEKYALENGLEVILHEDRRTPVVAVNVWYHVGSKDEPKGKNGFAHLFEHVMFQGSRNVGEDQFFKYLERAGASERNGTTNTDRTNYFETVPSNQLELALWLESDRMGFLLDHANQKTFESQREVVKNERRQNYENAPYGLVIQFIRAALYPEGHPYRLLTIGSPADLDAASFEDVRAFFRTFYIPNNATLVVAGDFETKTAKRLVHKFFGSLPRGPTPPVKKSPAPVELRTEKRLEIAANVELARVQITWPAPVAFTPDDLALDVAAELLTSGKSSRLYKRLVYDEQIAQSVRAAEWSAQLGGTFEIVATVKKGKSPADTLKSIDAELARLRKQPPSEAELERARARLVSELVFGNERVTARADALNTYNQMANDPGFLEKALQRYQSMSAADVAAAMNKWLPEGRRIVTVVMPDASAPRAGRLIAAKP